MPTMRLLWKRVYTAVATARWSVLLMVAAAHFLTSWMLLAAVGEADLTGHAVTFFYYYVVTATTVGYGDLSPVADAGRIAASLYVVPIAIAIFTAIIGKAITDITSYLRRNHMGMGSYAKKTGHIVVIGWQGDRTRRLLEGLLADRDGHEQPVLVSSSLTENPMPSEIDFISVETLSDGRGLERAGIAGSRTVIVRGRNDDETLAATLAAQASAPEAHIVAHFEEEGPSRLLAGHCQNVETVVSVSTDIIVRAACDPGSSALARLMFSGSTADTAYSVQIPPGVMTSFLDLLVYMKKRHGVTVIGTLCPAEGMVDLNCEADKQIGSDDVIYYIADHRIPANDIEWQGLKGKAA